MSYLNPLRLHFAGRFQANISTVNNDPGHFDNTTFLPSYQDMQTRTAANGWFSPEGDAAWRLIGCAITAAWTPDGAVKAGDPVMQCIVADSDGRVPGKLVDLDSEQQLVSEIWGLQVRIADADGHTLLRSDFEPAAFIDIWDRAVGSAGNSGDVDAGAMYQSVLQNLQWGDVSGSTFLTKLQTAAADGLLSIKFNVDGINFDSTSPDFLTGRIVGTIGPATAAEPHHLVLGRQFMAASVPGGNFFIPAGGINYCVAAADQDAGCIFLDLGNALFTSAADGTILDIGDLTLGVYNPPSSAFQDGGVVNPIGTIPSQGKGGYAASIDWYRTTAGVVALPLTAKQLQAIAAAPLVLSSATAAFIGEWSNGAFVRADRFVYRMSPGDSANIPVYATQWGQPLPGATIGVVADPSQLQPGNFIDPNDVPPVGTPPSALTFNATATTDQNGMAMLALQVTDPGTPRYFNNGQDYGIDGQVYGIRPSFVQPGFVGLVNQWDFISILLWSGFTASQPVTWADVEPIFVQYGNIYPVMNRFLNLGNYDSVVACAGLLTLAFGLDPANPNSMPVTRDLSPAKRQAILSFLANPLPAPATKTPPAMAVGARRAAPEPTPEAAAMARRGGKAAAAARRIVMQTATKGSPS
jgi:hypothetical protein